VVSQCAQRLADAPLKTRSSAMYSPNVITHRSSCQRGSWWPHPSLRVRADRCRSLVGSAESSTPVNCRAVSARIRTHRVSNSPQGASTFRASDCHVRLPTHARGRPRHPRTRASTSGHEPVGSDPAFLRYPGPSRPTPPARPPAAVSSEDAVRQAQVCRDPPADERRTRVSMSMRLTVGPGIRDRRAVPQ
jgi:hypothetical protein